MTVIFGGGSKMKNPGGLWVPYHCRRCDGLSTFLVVENYKYGHVYGIRVAKYKARYFLVCSRCDGTYVLETRERFIIAQEIARRLQVATGADLDVMSEVINVARFVIGDTELADALQRAQAGGYAEQTSSESVPPELPAAEDKVCPDCAETIKAAARKCRFCGLEFAET